MNREACAALNHLYAISPTARRVGESASGVLVFPSIVKAASNFERHSFGTLFADGRAIGYYKLIGTSYALPKGVQKLGYALFFMTKDDLASLRERGVWESALVGVLSWYKKLRSVSDKRRLLLRSRPTSTR